MTLTTFSSKQFKPLYAWALKRNKIIALVFAFFLLLFGPVLDLYYLSVDDFTEELGMISLVIFDMISALFTLISALKTFSFMHNKRSVDLYGALPSNRTTLFISHLLGGITAISLPYLVISSGPGRRRRWPSATRRSCWTPFPPSTRAFPPRRSPGFGSR